MMDGQDPDLRIVNLVKQGNRKAFDLLVLKYQGRVIALIYRYVNDSGLAEDIAQETFVKAYRSIESFKGNSAFYTWLYRIAVNTAKNHLNFHAIRVPLTDVSISDAEDLSGYNQLMSNASPEAQIEADQLDEGLRNALADLPDDMQHAFKFREYDGLSYEEISELMDTPIGTVRSRIFRAREHLEKFIKQYAHASN